MLVDTGANLSASGRKENFQKMKPLDAEINLGDNSKINADGIGTVNMHVEGVAAKDAEKKKGKVTNLELTLKQVVYSKAIPNNPPHDMILSIGKITDKGWAAIFQSPDSSIPKAKETIMDGSYLLHKESKTIIPLHRTKEGWYLLHGTAVHCAAEFRESSHSTVSSSNRIPDLDEETQACTD